MSWVSHFVARLKANGHKLWINPNLISFEKIEKCGLVGKGVIRKISSFSSQIPSSAWLGLGSQLHYETSGDLLRSFLVLDSRLR